MPVTRLTVPLSKHRAARTLAAGLAIVIAAAPPASAQTDTARAAGHDMHAGHDMSGSDRRAADAAAWRMPPMPPDMPMPPGLATATPAVAPFLPGMGIDPVSVPDAVFRTVEEMEDGDTLELEARLVRRTISGRKFVMYGFNGQYPGPLIKAPEKATIVVNFKNSTELATTVHWHGVRLDNRFDGVPRVTQDPVQPGGSFQYKVFFRDAGIYWYHPHHREDITQDMGLYGNMLVSSPDPDYFNPVNREEVVMLDDLLVDDVGLFPFGRETAVDALMGRFGNVMLVNGEPRYDLRVRWGEVVRFFFTNVSNTRIFNVSFGGLPIKVVGSDAGRFEREEMVDNVVISPAERYIVEVLFERPGEITLSNNIQAINHYRGIFEARRDTLGTISVARDSIGETHGDAFDRLRENREVVAEMDRLRPFFDRDPDHELELDVEIGELPLPLLQMMAADTFYFPPVEWNDVMPDMNYLATGRNVRWILRDAVTGRENMDIGWSFDEGDLVKLRIVNTPAAGHPMQHPIHIHGQRFLVISRDGVKTSNLVWKDTAVIPLGSTVDFLVEMSNPGEWMIHCHISEHLETGMKSVFTVHPADHTSARSEDGLSDRRQAPSTMLVDLPPDPERGDG